MMQKRIIVGLIAVAGVLISPTGCMNMGGNSKKPDMAENTAPNYALHGYCPVALHKGMFLKGNPYFVTEYQGKVYAFVKAEAQKAFVENPNVFLNDAEQQYTVLKKTHKTDAKDAGRPMPQSFVLHGYCPVALHKGMFLKGNPHFVTEYQGKVYTFVKAEAQKAFIEHPEVFLADAAAQYDILKNKHSEGSM